MGAMNGGITLAMCVAQHAKQSGEEPMIPKKKGQNFDKQKVSSDALFLSIALLFLFLLYEGVLNTACVYACGEQNGGKRESSKNWVYS